MSHWWSFLVGGVVFLIAVWLWEWMTGQQYEELVRDLDEHKAAKENERFLDEVSQQGLATLSRGEIWSRMTWLWQETRGWALRSGSVVSFACLGLFALLYVYVWLRTMIWPRAESIRLLISGRSLLLYVAQGRE